MPGRIYGSVPVSSITVTGDGGTTSVANGGTLQMIASVLPADATEKLVTWSVAPITGSGTINVSSGLLTGKTEGTIFVIATSTDGSNKSGFLIVTVTAPVIVSSITVSGAGNTTSIEEGKTLQMSASVLPSDATDKDVTWSVVNGTGSASISEPGLLSGITAGKVTVQASAKDASGISGTLEVTVTELSPPETAPEALSVSISGTAMAGCTLAGKYTYYDLNGDKESQSGYRWLQSDTSGGTYKAIEGAVSATFLLTSGQTGKFIKFEVTPKALTGTILEGNAVLSPATAAILPLEENNADDNRDIPYNNDLAASQQPVMKNVFRSSYEKTIQGFVTMFYNKVLGREPDAEGFNSWVVSLSGNTLSGAALVRGFIMSEENKSLYPEQSDEQFLFSLYNLVFNREPDPDGLKSWMSNLERGMARDEVIGYFTSSNEFIDMCSMYNVRP
jgi:uncharacterized protein YjdB